jgi:hypothetical protein
LSLVVVAVGQLRLASAAAVALADSVLVLAYL